MTAELAVALGAVVGAPARYLVDRAVARRAGTALPWGVLVVNLSGSAAAGVLAGLALSGATAALLAVGVLGAFTTASTLAWDVLELGGRRGAVVLALHVLPGLALAAAGVVVGRSLL